MSEDDRACRVAEAQKGLIERLLERVAQLEETVHRYGEQICFLNSEAAERKMAAENLARMTRRCGTCGEMGGHHENCSKNFPRYTIFCEECGKEAPNHFSHCRRMRDNLPPRALVAYKCLRHIVTTSVNQRCGFSEAQHHSHSEKLEKQLREVMGDGSVREFLVSVSQELAEFYN